MLRLVRSLQSPQPKPSQASGDADRVGTPTPAPDLASLRPTQPQAWGDLSQRLLNRLDQVEAAEVPTLQPGAAPAPSHRT